MHEGKVYLYPDCMKLRILKLRILHCMLLKYILYLVLHSMFIVICIYIYICVSYTSWRYLEIPDSLATVDESVQEIGRILMKDVHVPTFMWSLLTIPFTLLSWPSSLDRVIISLQGIFVNNTRLMVIFAVYIVVIYKLDLSTTHIHQKPSSRKLYCGNLFLLLEDSRDWGLPILYTDCYFNWNATSKP